MKRGEMLDKAILLATNGHHGQFDRGGKPYILHCLAVLHTVDSDDEEVQCIAVMHDLIEDTKTTYADLREAGFTERVIAGVRAITKVPGYTYEEYQEQVLANKDAVLVKMADLKHNSDITRLKGVREKDIDRMVKYQKFYLILRASLEQ